MQENLSSKPFILALHDEAHTLRELRDEETQRVAGGDGICWIDTLIVTPGCESTEWECDD